MVLENDRLCPRCGSLQRTRRLWQILNDGLMDDRSRILDFSPSRSLFRLMKNKPHYISSDFAGEFLSAVSFDITKIDTKSESFDLVICYHILEHIEDDLEAMAELFRVLKKGGHALIQTPFKKGEIYEDDTIVAPEQREIHFGQFDHVRIYSIEGLKERLENAGFKVTPRHFTPDRDNLHGFNTDETVLICERPQ